MSEAFDWRAHDFNDLLKLAAEASQTHWPIAKDRRYRIQCGLDEKLRVVYNCYFGDEYVGQSCSYSSAVTKLVCFQQRRDAALAEKQIFGRTEEKRE
jgi:hypothetical protein